MVFEKSSSIARCQTSQHQDEGHILLLQYLKQQNVKTLKVNIRSYNYLNCRERYKDQDPCSYTRNLSSCEIKALACEQVSVSVY